MADLTALLLATQDPSRPQAERSAAEKQIQAAEQANVEQYFLALAQELANIQKPAIARQLAGLLLKGGLFAKDPARDLELKTRWAGIAAASREQVKQTVTSTIATPEKDVGKAAAQVVAKIGRIEVPAQQWPTLVPLLLEHVRTAQGNVKQISLVTLGYLCEELVALPEDGDVIPDEQCNNVLTAVVQGMRDPDVPTKLEATRAFYHAVVLAQKNFKREVERNVIMEVTTEVCRLQGPDTDAVRIAAFECLVQIANQYYDYLTPYMNVIGPLTWETIKTAPENVAIPAMEFWSTICDEELYLQDLQMEGTLGGRQMLNLIKQALQFLTPVLLETLTKRQSEDDDDTWNLAMAGGTALNLVAQVAGDDCVDLVLQFVHGNFRHADWRFRDAAVLAYGSIMEGPSSAKMQPIVAQSYSSMVAALNDDSVAVRDTIAWTLGRIARFHPTIIPVKELTPILGQKLQDAPRVSANICCVLKEMAESQNLGSPSTALSEYFADLAKALLVVTARPDADEKNLRSSAYNTLSSLVQHAGNDCLSPMEQLMQEMLNHLQNSFKIIDKDCELQGLICGVLTSLTQRLGEKITGPVADALMEECLKVFEAYKQARGGVPCLHEEALLTIGALAKATGIGFAKYMNFFAPHLMVGLRNFEEVQACIMATGVICECCQALDAQMGPYCKPILEILYGNLQNPAVDRKIKAGIMTSIGDLALVITGDFETFLPPIVNMLQEASKTKLDEGRANDEDWVEYLNSLRVGVLEAYTGIIHGLRAAGKLHLLKNHVNGILHFVHVLTEDPSVTQEVMKAAVGVIYDLIFAYERELMAHLDNAPFMAKVIDFSQRANCGQPIPLQQLLAKYRGQ